MTFALPLYIYIDYLDYLINRLLRSVLYFQIFGKFSRILFFTDLVFNSVVDFFNTQSIQKSVVQFSGVWRCFCYLSSLDFQFNDIMDRDNIALIVCNSSFVSFFSVCWSVAHTYIHTHKTLQYLVWLNFFLLQPKNQKFHKNTCQQ